MFELKEIECPHCSGYGWLQDEVELIDCVHCGGTGMIAVERTTHGCTTAEA